MINKARLTKALSTIKADGDGRLFASSNFLNLDVDMRIASAHGKNFPRQLLSSLQYIEQDVWNLQTLAQRLEWQKHLIAQRDNDYLILCKFVACDINLFHVQFRSVFDYIAKTLALSSNKPGSVPSASFEKLQNWLRKEAHQHTMGEELAQIAISCDWFRDLREVRNEIVHSGGETLAFPESGRILFQVYDAYKNRKIHFREVMFNDYIVDFELYCGLFMGYLISYLEKVAQAVRSKFDVKGTGSNVQSYHGGLPVLRDWMKRVRTLEDEK